MDFGEGFTEDFYEQCAMCDETALDFSWKRGASGRRASPPDPGTEAVSLFYGSALKLTGVDEFLDGLERFVSVPVYGKTFGAKVFKIARDDQGNRLTYMKITGGSLQVKAVLTNAGKAGEKEVWEEKVNQIRIYSGDKYELVNEVQAGSVCAVTGLNHTHPGEGLGAEAASAAPVLEPVLTYSIRLPQECPVPVMLPSCASWKRRSRSFILYGMKGCRKSSAGYGRGSD